MDYIPVGSTNISVVFTLSQVVTIADLKLGYIRWTSGDGTTFTETLSGALTALANINSAHADNKAIHLDQSADKLTGGNQFNIRVDFPDACFASGADRVVCNIYDDGNDVVAQRIFRLTPIPADLVQIAGAATVDGIAIGTMFENFISALQGDIVRSSDTYTYKKQDGSTTTFSYTISTAGRS